MRKIYRSEGEGVVVKVGEAVIFMDIGEVCLDKADISLESHNRVRFLVQFGKEKSLFGFYWEKTIPIVPKSGQSYSAVTIRTETALARVAFFSASKEKSVRVELLGECNKRVNFYMRENWTE